MEFKQIFSALPENEKLVLIEKVMPCSGTHRQLEEQGSFSDGQIKEMAELFFNQNEWEQGLELEEIDIHDKSHFVYTTTELGNDFEAVGYYSDGSLLFIDDLEFKKSTE